MSIDAYNWAWRQKLNCGQKLVLLCLADRADEDGRAWPSVKRMALDTCMDERSVYRHIKSLADIGLISIEPISGKGNTYQLIGIQKREDRQGTPDNLSSPPCQFVTPDNLSPLTVCQGTPDNLSGPPLTKTTKNGRASIYESKEEPSKNPKSVRARKPKPPRCAFGQFGNVRLTQDEYDKLISENGGAKAQKAIAKLDAYIGSKGDRYKSHYMAMHSWVLRAVEEDEARGAPLQRAGPPQPQTYQQYERENQKSVARMALAGWGVTGNGEQTNDHGAIDADHHVVRETG